MQQAFSSQHSLPPEHNQPTRCRWGLAYASGPYPNVMTGPDDATFPVFGPTAAKSAEEHAVVAARMAQRAAAAGGGGEERRDLLRREVQLTELLAKR